MKITIEQDDGTKIIIERQGDALDEFRRMFPERQSPYIPVYPTYPSIPAYPWSPLTPTYPGIILTTCNGNTRQQ